MSVGTDETHIKSAKQLIVLHQGQFPGFDRGTVLREDVNIRGSWVKHIREFSVLVSQFVS